MKEKYNAPTINVELLAKADVLMISEETDNRYIKSNLVAGNNFEVESIL